MEPSSPLFSLTYNGPIFMVGFFWVLFRAQEYMRAQQHRRVWIMRLLIDIAVFSAAFARFFGSSIPPSGHALLLTHTLISVSNRYYRLAALVTLLGTAGFKISWHDYTSLGYGILLGVLTGAGWLWAGRNQVLQPDVD